MHNGMRIRIDGFRKGALLLAFFLVLASVQMAFGHEGSEHVMGTVTKVSVQSVTVKTTDNKIVEVGLNAKTTCTRDDKKVALSDMKVGDRVMIEAKEVNEKLVADSVKLGTAASKSDHDHSEHK
jgi:Cu/Ag efflux protein CusF